MIEFSMTPNQTSVVPDLSNKFVPGGDTNDVQINAGNSRFGAVSSNTGSVRKVLTQVDGEAPTWEYPEALTNLIFMLSADTSDISGYLDMVELSGFVEQSSPSISAVASTTPTLLKAFATVSGMPNKTSIPIGQYHIHFETEKNAGSNNYFVFAEIYKRTSGGTETLIATTDHSSEVSSNTVISQNVSAYNASIVTLNTTDRIVVKIYAQMLSATATINLYVDNGTDARFELPSVVGSSQTLQEVTDNGATTTNAISISNTLAVAQSSTDAVIIGDVSGNARGSYALDVQTARDINTQVASGDYATAVGYENTASGESSTAVGYINAAVGGYSTAVGYDNHATFVNSSAFGRANIASAPRATAVGYTNSASNTYTSALGYSNTASGTNATAVGSGNIVSANGASAFGSSIINSTANSTMIGPSDSAKMTILSTGDIGIGTTSPTTKLHTISTTEQVRTGYDASNYFSTTVGSTGSTTFNLMGTSPEFTFSDPVNVPDEAYGAGWNGNTEVPTKNAIYDKIETISGGATQVFNQIPAGSINSSNTVFTTSTNFTPTTVRVYLNGLRQTIADDYTETDVNEITFITAPTTGDTLIIDYQQA